MRNIGTAAADNMKSAEHVGGDHKSVQKRRENEESCKDLGGNNKSVKNQRGNYENDEDLKENKSVKHQRGNEESCKGLRENTKSVQNRRGNTESCERLRGDGRSNEIIEDKPSNIKTSREKGRRRKQKHNSASEVPLMNFALDSGGDAVMGENCPGPGWTLMKPTVDSGAAHSVFNGDDWPSIPLEESRGSKSGQVYVGPGKEKIPNRGQKHLKVRVNGSEAIRKMTFQDANVRKPLMAVSGCTSRGNLVLFDGEGSFVAPGGNAEAEKIQKLIRQIKGRIGLEEERGVFLMPVWVRTGESSESQTEVSSRPVR